MFKKVPAFMEPKVYYRFHRSPPLVPILIQLNLVCTLSPYLYKINFNILQSTGRYSKKSLLLGFPAEILCAFSISPMRAVCPTYRSLLDLIILIILVNSTYYGTMHYVDSLLL